MASSIILSPEYLNAPRREAVSATAAVVATGSFCSLDASGNVVSTAAAAARQYIALENVSTAQGLNYVYQADETVFMAMLPKGCSIAAPSIPATYTAGQEVEIGAGGEVTKLASGIAVGVVVEAATTTNAAPHLKIDLL